MAHETNNYDFYNDPSKSMQERRNNYLIVNAISKRVRDLQAGTRATVSNAGDVVDTARQELLEDRLVIVPDEAVQRLLEAAQAEEERKASVYIVDVESDVE